MPEVVGLTEDVGVFVLVLDEVAVTEGVFVTLGVLVTLGLTEPVDDKVGVPEVVNVGVTDKEEPCEGVAVCEGVTDIVGVILLVLLTDGV